jgi:hypothetical protein
LTIDKIFVGLRPEAPIYRHRRTAKPTKLLLTRVKMVSAPLLSCGIWILAGLSESGTDETITGRISFSRFYQLGQVLWGDGKAEGVDPTVSSGLAVGSGKGEAT